MATYRNEKTGETVVLVDGSWEDTRVGALALDGKGGWSKVEDPPAAPVAAEDQAPPKEATVAATEPATRTAPKPRPAPES